jgi:hypothetical protein
MKDYIKDKLSQKINSLRIANGIPVGLLDIHDDFIESIYQTLSSGRYICYEIEIRWSPHLDFRLNLVTYYDSNGLPAVGRGTSTWVPDQKDSYIFFDIAEVRDRKLDEVLELKCHTLTN